MTKSISSVKRVLVKSCGNFSLEYERLQRGHSVKSLSTCERLKRRRESKRRKRSTASECAVIERLETFGKLNFLKRGTAVERKGFAVDYLIALEYNLFQARAAHKHTVTVCLDVFGNDYLLKRRKIRKRIITEIDKGFGKDKLLERRTPSEAVSADNGNAFGNNDLCDPLVAVE